MRPGRALLTALVSLWLLAGLQGGLAPRLAIFGASPDFLLIFATCFGMMGTRAVGAVAGFSAGVVHGAIAGANLTHYAISRTLVGFTASWSRDLGFEDNPVFVGIVGAVATVLGQVVLMFLAAPREIAGFLGATILSALYNGVLVVPLYALLKQAIGPPPR